MIRVLIVGAGRSRNGIGEYIGKYFHKNKAQVVAVLGTTQETSLRAASALEKYGITSTPYSNFDEMVDRESPDVLVIASPASTHYDYLARALESGLHVFCEKPFIWSVAGPLEKAVSHVLNRAREKQLTLAMNSQLPFTLNDYEKLCGKMERGGSNRFYAAMSPFASGAEMIPDTMPHVLSLLYAVFGEGKVRNVRFESTTPRDLKIEFQYVGSSGICETRAELASQERQPRPFRFGWNGKIVSRSLDLANYDIYFNHEGKRLKIQDPLEASVTNFIEAIERKVEPLIGSRHILNNTVLLKEIFDQYGGA
jgi:predicted dehydrogenase